MHRAALSLSVPSAVDRSPFSSYHLHSATKPVACRMHRAALFSSLPDALLLIIEASGIRAQAEAAARKAGGRTNPEAAPGDGPVPRLPPAAADAGALEDAAAAGVAAPMGAAGAAQPAGSTAEPSAPAMPPPPQQSPYRKICASDGAGARKPPPAQPPSQAPPKEPELQVPSKAQVLVTENLRTLHELATDFYAQWDPFQQHRDAYDRFQLTTDATGRYTLAREPPPTSADAEDVDDPAPVPQLQQLAVVHIMNLPWRERAAAVMRLLRGKAAHLASSVLSINKLGFEAMKKWLEEMAMVGTSGVGEDEDGQDAAGEMAAQGRRSSGEVILSTIHAFKGAQSG